MPHSIHGFVIILTIWWTSCSETTILTIVDDVSTMPKTTVFWRVCFVESNLSTCPSVIVATEDPPYEIFRWCFSMTISIYSWDCPYELLMLLYHIVILGDFPCIVWWYVSTQYLYWSSLIIGFSRSTLLSRSRKWVVCGTWAATRGRCDALVVSGQVSVHLDEDGSLICGYRFSYVIRIAYVVSLSIIDEWYLFFLLQDWDRPSCPMWKLWNIPMTDPCMPYGGFQLVMGGSKSWLVFVNGKIPL